MLGLLGFYDEFDDGSGRPNGSLRDAVPPPESRTSRIWWPTWMPAIITARFAPHYNDTMPLVDWASAVPWRSTTGVLEPGPRTVTTKAEFDAATLARKRNRPQGVRAKPRKPRRA